jgi:hypothetical protein
MASPGRHRLILLQLSFSRGVIAVYGYTSRQQNSKGLVVVMEQAATKIYFHICLLLCPEVDIE